MFDEKVNKKVLNYSKKAPLYLCVGGKDKEKLFNNKIQ